MLTQSPFEFLLEATVIRSVLVPAAMELLGHRNWYLPGRLQWLPHYDIESGTASEGTPGVSAK